MNIIEGFYSRAISNKILTNFSLSPTNFDIRSDELIEKNVALHSNYILKIKFYICLLLMLLQ